MEHPKRHVSFGDGQAKQQEKPAEKPAATVPPKGLADRWKLSSQYEVKQLIGTGSYGSVAEAYDWEKKQLVAIKRIAHVFDDLVDCKRILREVSILRKLDHPHVVRIFDLLVPSSSRTFEELYVVMEICDSDLKKLCRTDCTLEMPHINTLLYNLLVGLKYLHSAGIYHRDLKPANCLVNQDCTVKICDFGLSRAIGDADMVGVNSLPDGENQDGPAPAAGGNQRLQRHLTGHVVTRWYRAPELILLQETYTEAIDTWSVGCIYAELLGMLEGTKPADRGPLFPGSSCFPLSPDHKHKTDYKYHTKGKHDQLNMIFNLLGTPSEADIQSLEREDARRYIKCFAPREGEGVKSKFPNIDDDAAKLLTGMLQFSPTSRWNVDKALQHNIFHDVRDLSKEKVASSFITLDFEREPDLDEHLLRRYFIREVKEYHSDVVEI
mmetsp:Transcript_33761/g.93279  ORF Transcript_33761/g.93279 Transcript_33761/m.93279 type:complete len:437 (-) Transcript_33761:132-1442(-)